MPLPSGARGTYAGFAAFGLLWGGWAALVPQVQADLAASKGALGLALLCVGAGALPAMLLVGPQINRRGPAVMPFALAALAAAALLPAFAWSVPTLALALLVVGAASGAVDVSINAAAAEVEATTGTRIMQLAHALFSVGVIVGAISAGLVRQAGGGRVQVLAGIAVVLLLAAFASRDAPARTSATGSSRIRLRRSFVVLGIACGAAFLVEGGIENWSALFLERELDAGPAVSALGPGAYAAAMVTGRLLGQHATGRISDHMLLGGGAVLSALGLVLAAAAPSAPVAVLAFFVGGAGVSVAAPVAFSAAGRGAGAAERGSAVATVTTIGYLGFLAGPPLTGGAAELIGLRASFVVLACVAGLLALGSTRLRLEPAEAAGALA